MFNRFIIAGLLLLNLTGCTYFSNRAAHENNNIEFIEWKKYKDSCAIENDDCPAFILKTVKFKDELLLNTIIDNSLLELLNDNSEENDSLRKFQHAYLLTASPGDNITLTVKPVAQNDVMIVLELSIMQTSSDNSYNPIRKRYINFDKAKQQKIELSDVLLPSKQEAFGRTVQSAYDQWLELNQLLNNKVFLEDWPFQQTDNMALLNDSLVLKYPLNTLAPYAMDFPELFIPYSQLQNIIQSIYIPR